MVLISKGRIRILLFLFITIMLLHGYLIFKINLFEKYVTDIQTNEFRMSNFSELCRRLNINPDENVSFNSHYINVTRSNEIGSRRFIPDVRNSACARIPYNTDLLPDATIIMLVYDEPWSTLLRTIHSILQNTPEHLLKELIIIDDSSPNPALQKPLRIYLEQIPNAKLIRTTHKLGVSQGRKLGAEHATGEILVYIDSHCEVNKDWLQPMVYEIAKHNRTVTGPIIDYINPNSFQYEAVRDYIRGGIMWDLEFKYTDIPTQSKVGLLPSDPYSSPALPGGVFAINRKFLSELGGFDSDMQIWGGEDVDISIRTWLCGGRMLLCPCSRVGHVFKNGHSYSIDPKLAQRNIINIAENWLNSYKRIFYSVTGGSLQPDSKKSYNKYDTVKKNLNCKPFGWYLENVFPELGVPPAESLYFGPLEKDGVCLGLETDFDNVVKVFGCFSYQSKNVALLRNGDLRMGSSCIEPNGDTFILKVCNQTDIGKWTFHRNKLLYRNKSCLHLENRRDLKLIPCVNGSEHTSNWKFRYQIAIPL